MTRSSYDPNGKTPAVSAVVCAAGMSSRMGGTNKLLLPWTTGSLIEQVVDTVLAAQVIEVIVVVGHEAERVHHALGRRAVRMAHNPVWPTGLTSTIQTGVRAAQTHTDGFLICLSDQPLIETRDLDRLIRAFREAGGKSIVVPVFRGRRGNPVLFPASFRSRILSHEDSSGCKGIIQAAGQGPLEVEMSNDHVVKDIDTREQYQRLHGGTGAGTE